MQLPGERLNYVPLLFSEYVRTGSSMQIFEPSINQLPSGIGLETSRKEIHSDSEKGSRELYRQGSIIDSLLENRKSNEADSIGSRIQQDRNQGSSNTTPSIEYIVHQNEAILRSAHKLSAKTAKIDDIFANRPALSSREVNSSQILKFSNEPLYVINSFAKENTSEKEQNKEFKKLEVDRIILPSFPSQEDLSEPINYPDQLSFNRPFLRKKTDEHSTNHLPEPALTRRQSSKRDEEINVEYDRLDKKLSQQKQTNRNMQSILTILQQNKKVLKIPFYLLQELHSKKPMGLIILKAQIQRCISNRRAAND